MADTKASDEAPAAALDPADGVAIVQGGNDRFATFSQFSAFIYQYLSDSDPTLAPDSDDLLPTKSAVKAYVDTEIAGVSGGGASGLQFTASSTTTDSDPGTGTLRWNNATQASATLLYIDNADADSTSLAALWASVRVETMLKITEAADPDVWQLWKVTTAPVDGTGYYKFGVTLQAQEGGNIANATAILLDVDVSGAAAFTGGTLTSPLITTASGTGAAGFNLPHGSAPSSPSNGDVWTTTSGMFARISGSTVGPFSAGGGSLTHFTESTDTASPNGSINNNRLIATGAGSAIAITLSWKGSAFLSVQRPDGTATGGNIRANRSIDLGSNRASATQVASGVGAFHGPGTNMTASGQNATAMNGSTVVASGQNSFAVGDQVTASALNGFVRGNYATDRGIQSDVFGSGSSTQGNRQWQDFILYTDSAFSASTRTLTTDGGGAGTTNQAILSNSSAYLFEALVLMRGGSDNWAVEIKGMARRDANAASTLINGVSTAITGTDIYKSGGVAGLGWTVDVIADTTNGGISVRTKGDTGQIVLSDARLRTLQLAW